ncbi:TPA: protein translocase subunit SecF [Patescibacteria group bacterium]|nr:MAG: protein-export membrane protein SecF [Candidatus Gottesmanbacteria bacterium RIFCSPHIGHO2_01_FULL_43_15]OGG25353.1 MAG: protein-export membrane protein SecF [Candidatus Gottesmanbacteria bacterium RIFCSPLOWO2_01_FULL_42_10]HCM38144.1 protein translocase subunit SecF [Patescibacteria group bacterium]
MLNFMRYRWVYFVISSLIIVPGIFSLVKFGLKPGIDFTGGTLIEIKLEKAEGNVSEEVKQTISPQGGEVGSVQNTDQGTYIIRMKPIEQVAYEKIKTELGNKYGAIEEIRFETVGPSLGQELLQKTGIAAILAIGGILFYIAWAFKNVRYGISAIIALAHDLLVVVGIFSLLGKYMGVEVDSLFVTALLTTMSFSVHDTIVVFDKIREHMKKRSGETFAEQINLALTETMGRSLNNSLTIIFMLLALFLLGGESIKWFVLALLIGTISGTYSSPFVATPILFIWNELTTRKIRKST